MIAASAAAPWAFRLHADVWILVAVIGVGYWWLVDGERWKRASNREPGAPAAPPAVTRKQAVLFYSGLAAMWIGADWPVHDVAEGSLYLVHMLQHMLFVYAAAPLMLMGTPDWMFRKLIRPRPVYAVMRFMSRTFVALIFFNAVLVFTHWPLIVNDSVANGWLHFGLHCLLFVAAIWMWMPVCSPVIEIPRPSYPGQMVYMFLQSLVPTVPASFLTFGARPLYSAYISMPKLWGISALTDQRSAGLLMKIGGGFILWGVLTALFFKWWSIEHSEGIDVLAFHNVDRDVNRQIRRDAKGAPAR